MKLCPPIRPLLLLLAGGMVLQTPVSVSGQTADLPERGPEPGAEKRPPFDPPQPPGRREGPSGGPGFRGDPERDRMNGGGGGPPPPGGGDRRPGGPGPGPGPGFGPGDRRGPGGRGGPMFGEGFERLSEEQKRRVRDALARAWGSPEVAKAREEMMQANDRMKEAIHRALKEVDPEIASLLARMRGPDSWGERGEAMPLPEPGSPDFPRAVVARLEREMLMFAPPEWREKARQLHGRLMEGPAVREALERLRAAPPEQRMRATEELRRIYRDAAGDEIRKLRPRLPEEGQGSAREPAPAAERSPTEGGKPAEGPAAP